MSSARQSLNNVNLWLRCFRYYNFWNFVYGSIVLFVIF